MAVRLLYGRWLAGLLILLLAGCGGSTETIDVIGSEQIDAGFTSSAAEPSGETSTTADGGATKISNDEELETVELPTRPLELTGDELERFVEFQAAFEDLNMSGEEQDRIAQGAQELFGDAALVATRALAIEGHRIGGTVIDVWTDDDTYLATGSGAGTGMIAVAVAGTDQVVTVPFWDRGGNWTMTRPSVLHADAQPWGGIDVGPELRVGESWDLPATGLAVMVPGAIVFIDSDGQPSGHVVTTNLTPDDGTLADWLTAAGRDLQTFSGAFSSRCVELADRTLEACHNDDGSVTLTHDSQVIAGPDTWNALAEANPDVPTPIVDISNATYSEEADAWLLAWRGGTASCWLNNTLVLQNGVLSHPTGNQLSTTPPVTPIGWVGDRAAYRTWGSQANDCTPGTDESTLYLQTPGQEAIPILSELTNLQALTFDPTE